MGLIKWAYEDSSDDEVKESGQEHNPGSSLMAVSEIWNETNQESDGTGVRSSRNHEAFLDKAASYLILQNVPIFR